ncbi:hypothetical protein [Pseudomonas sp. Ant30-3]|uniref:hypothetical protein n=1 Tax=Pseudomonas sp. Ant30-3 TaxID=1488328 RepID=UPI00048F3441|nr:hypothetical protein [Pseudomonas sp. Ant30-3]
MSLIYHDPSISHDEAVSLLDSGLEKHIVTALISVGLNEQDSAWAQTVCLDHLKSGTQSVAAAAITALGHIARRFGELEMQVVIPALDAVQAKFPALEASVADTLDDIEMFT